MKNQELKDISYKKVAWTIKNFSTLKTRFQHCSEVFTIDGCAWEISLYRGRQDGKHLALYLRVADVSSLAQGWNIDAAYTLTVVNQASPEKSVKKDSTHKFCANHAVRGCPSFMELAKLQNPSNGYIMNDKCIVAVEFSKLSSEGYQVIPKDDQTVEFKDLGQIEKALVPALEEVCSWHPSLMECKKKRSRPFTEWAFTTLGRVLHFLDNSKWKDINVETCEQLQHLWEELEMSRLDLSWLEPRVKYVLKMKGYVEKAKEVKRLKQELVVLETEMGKIKENLTNTELTIEKTRKDLIKKELYLDHTELDLDTVIGYEKFT